MRTFISFDEARQIVLQSAVRTGTETVSFDQALGRTLAQHIVSQDTVPPFDNSAMDGFAVRRADTAETPVRLEIAADIPAGIEFTGTIEGGQAARIMTGAPVPDGTDAVVPVEKTRMDGDTGVWIDETPRKSAHIRRAGEELIEGDLVLESGLVVTPPVIGVFATLGITKLMVSAAPRVAIISTGDELVAPHKKPGPGQIRNSNGPALAAQTLSAGGNPCRILHALDNPADIRRVISKAQDVDLIVFSGGVSMGEYDYVRTELDNMGARWEFWKVRQRPGKPLAFGYLNDIPVIGLPGNPVSSSICFEEYVRPLLAQMMGRANVIRPLEPALLTMDTPKVEALYTFARGVLAVSAGRPKLTVSITGNQASNRITSMVHADCILHLPEGLAEAPAGSHVMIERLEW